MEKYKIFVGIDISKHWIDVVVLQNQSPLHRQFNNNKKDYKVMTGWLKTFSTKNQMLLCMEHTGVYGLPLWNYLSQQQIPFVVQTGLQIKSSMGIRRGKTDKADAHVIARYIRLHHTEVSLHKVPAKIITRLKVLHSYRERLVKIKQQLAVADKEISGFMTRDLRKEMSKDSQSLVAIIEQRITKINKVIEAVIASDGETKRIYDLVKSVRGIGPVIATYLIIITENFTILNEGRKLSNYGGMAPHKNQSGIINRKAKVSHLCNKKIKSLLSNAVKSNLKHDTETKEYFARKAAEGKLEGLIFNNLKNKLIHKICAVVKRGTPYVDIKKYSTSKKTA